MRHLLTLLAALFLCSAPLHAQTLKSLMFNSTNGQVVANTGTNVLTFTNQGMVFESSITFEDDITANAFDASIGTNSVRVQHDQIVFAGTSADVTRTNLSLGLPALTNTSNVTAMRALSGSTNTNHPYSGSISVVGTNNTNTLVFSNGILQEVQ